MAVPSFYGTNSASRTNGKSVAVFVAGDWKNSLKALERNLEVLRPSGCSLNACLILDADDKSAEFRFQKLKNELPQFEFGSKPGDFAGTDPRCGAYFLPNNQDPGTLETLLLEQAERAYPDLMALADDYLGKVIDQKALSRSKDRELLNKPVGKEKARLSAMSAVLKPEKGLAISIQDNAWFRFKPDALTGANTEALFDFLKRFFELLEH